MSPSNSSPPGSSMGKGMSAAAWVLGLILLTMMFGNMEQNWFNPNQQPETKVSPSGVQEVVLRANRAGQYMVSGKINNIEADFLLDTGATNVALSTSSAKRLGLKRGAKGRAVTANGSVITYATRINRLQIGSIILYDVPASINPSMGNFILLGMSALRQVELMQKDGILKLRHYPNN